MDDFHCTYCKISESFEPDPDEDGRIPKICENLGYSSREKHGFYHDVETYTPNFRSKDGITGSDLLDWDNDVHRRGLKEMAHEFLCTDVRGPKYWPGRHGDLVYLRDCQEIYRRLIYLFIKVNKRLRAKAIRTQAAAGIVDQEPPRPNHVAAVDMLLDMGNSADDPIDIDNLQRSAISTTSTAGDTKTETSQAETPQHSTNELPNDVPHNTREQVIPQTNNLRATDSPDQLALDVSSRHSLLNSVFATDDSQENVADIAEPARKRRKTWGRYSGFLTRVSPSIMSSDDLHSSAGGGPAGDVRQDLNGRLNPTTTTTTTATDMESHVSPGPPVAEASDDYNHSAEPDSQLDQPATPKSTMSSQVEIQGDNNENTSAAKFDPRSFILRTEEQQQDPDMIPARVDPQPKFPERRATPNRRPHDVHKVDLIFSVNVSRGNNIRWKPVSDLFDSSLQDFFQGFPLRGAFQALSVTLEVPRWRKKPKRYRDVIRRDDKDDFRIIMTRFSQKVDAFKLSRTCRRLARRVVLEISVEPLKVGKIGNGA